MANKKVSNMKEKQLFRLEMRSKYNLGNLLGNLLAIALVIGLAWLWVLLSATPVG